MRAQTRIGPATLVLAGLGLFWMVAILPGWQRAEELPRLLRDVERRARQDLEARAVIERTLRKLQEQEKEFGPLLRVPREADHSGTMIRKVHRLCAVAGVQLLTVHPQPATPHGEFRRFPLQLNVEGNLESLTQLLLKLRDTRPVIDVERVSLRAGRERISATLTLASYAWSPRKTKPKP